jgi:hypothetical protein
MAVCKQIYHETREYLAKENAFVVVDFHTTGFLQEIHTFNVPIVTDKRIVPWATLDKFPRFDYWAARIRISWQRGIARDMHQNFRFFVEDGDVNNIEHEGRLLMILADIPKLCEVLRFLCLWTVYPCVHVLSGQAIGLRMGKAMPRGIPYTEVEARKVGHAKVRPLFRRFQKNPDEKWDEQKELLKAIGTVTGRGYDINFRGFDDRYTVLMQQVKDRTSPSVIWQRAIEYQRLKSALKMSDDIETMLQMTWDDEGALSRYTRLWRYLRVQPPAVWNRATVLLQDLDRLRSIDDQRLCLVLDIQLARAELFLRPNTLRFRGYSRMVTSLGNTPVNRMAIWNTKVEIYLYHLLALGEVFRMLHEGVGFDIHVLRYYLYRVRESNLWMYDPCANCDVPKIEELLKKVDIVGLSPVHE